MYMNIVFFIGLMLAITACGVDRSGVNQLPGSYVSDNGQAIVFTETTVTMNDCSSEYYFSETYINFLRSDCRGPSTVSYRIDGNALVLGSTTYIRGN